MDTPTPNKPTAKPKGAAKPKAPMKSPRERFVTLHVKRVKNARRALRNVARMGNRKQYDASEDERAAILKILREDMAEVERAFRGAPKEKGLFDL